MFMTASRCIMRDSLMTLLFLNCPGCHFPSHPNMVSTHETSALKSSYKTGKKPRLDRTTTDQNRKTSRPVRTVTAVRSLVHPFSKNLKTDEKTGLIGLNRSFAP